MYGNLSMAIAYTNSYRNIHFYLKLKVESKKTSKPKIAEKKYLDFEICKKVKKKYKEFRILF